MKYQLSVTLTAIRTERWMTLYNSIKNSFSGTWEIIFVGPYPLPEEMKELDNVKYIEDWGSVSRCQQIAICEAQGEYILWTADDGIFMKDSIDNAFKILAENGFKKDIAVLGKYFEGENIIDAFSPMMDTIEYYKINTHDGARTKAVPDDCLFLNQCIATTEFIKELGGIDSENFEVCGLAYVDLSIRAYKAGLKTIFMDEVMYKCGFMPGETGDHKPIHNAHVYHDDAVYNKFWRGDVCSDRIKIELDNWKTSPDRWKRRFGKECN